MNKPFYQLQKYWLTGINRKLFHPQILFGASLVRWCNLFKFQIKTNLYKKKIKKYFVYLCISAKDYIYRRSALDFLINSLINFFIFKLVISASW